ncbi:MFS transporter [Micromonospora sp. NBC_01392]|uniref:MFS transporter n=1 Tax=Micromonospora sp. NBC_01392 TaxID=2903588 RepID=UPI00324A3943
MAPPSRTVGRVSTQALLYGLGSGSYLTINAVFFTKIIGLSASAVGLGLTIAGITTFLAAVPLGRASDRISAKKVWGLASLVEAVCFMAYPLASGFASFLAIVMAIGVCKAAGGVGYGGYVLNLYSDEERVAGLAYNRSALNAGFTAGAGLGGLALATGSDTAIRLLPVFIGVVLLVNATVIRRLPELPKPAPAPSAARESRRWVGALVNRPFFTLSVLSGVLSTNQVVLSVVVPLWLVQETNAPRVLLAGLLATNTFMAVSLQSLAARGTDTESGAVRATYRSAACFVASCVLIAFTDGTIEWLTIVLVWVAHVVLTGAELFQAAASWGFTQRLSDPARRGEYMGIDQVGQTIGSVWAPAVYTFLAMNWERTGWFTIAAIVVLAAVVTPFVARAAERSLRWMMAGNASDDVPSGQHA